MYKIWSKADMHFALARTAYRLAARNKHGAAMAIEHMQRAIDTLKAACAEEENQALAAIIKERDEALAAIASLKSDCRMIAMQRDEAKSQSWVNVELSSQLQAARRERDEALAALGRKPPSGHVQGGASTPSSSMRNRVLAIVTEHMGLKPGEVTEDSRFIEDLGTDSLDSLDIANHLSAEFGIELDEELHALQTVGQTIKHIGQKLVLT